MPTRNSKTLDGSFSFIASSSHCLNTHMHKHRKNTQTHTCHYITFNVFLMVQSLDHNVIFLTWHVLTSSHCLSQTPLWWLETNSTNRSKSNSICSVCHHSEREHCFSLQSKVRGVIMHCQFHLVLLCNTWKRCTWTAPDLLYPTWNRSDAAFINNYARQCFELDAKVNMLRCWELQC